MLQIRTAKIEGERSRACRHAQPKTQETAAKKSAAHPRAHVRRSTAIALTHASVVCGVREAMRGNENLSEKRGSLSFLMPDWLPPWH